MASLIGPDQLAIDLDARGSARARAPVARMMCWRRQRGDRLAVLRRPRAVPCPASLAGAVEHRDLVLLQQMRDAGGELLGDRARALHDLVEVEADVVGGEAEFVEMMQQMIDLGGAQQRLGRDAAPVEADAAEMLALDHGDLHSELRGADRRDIAAGAAADDDQVKFLSSPCSGSSFLFTPASAARASPLRRCFVHPVAPARAEAVVEIDRRLVPVQHRPFHARTAARRRRGARDAEDRPADAAPAIVRLARTRPRHRGRDGRSQVLKL